MNGNKVAIQMLALFVFFVISGCGGGGGSVPDAVPQTVPVAAPVTPSTGDTVAPLTIDGTFTGGGMYFKWHQQNSIEQPGTLFVSADNQNWTEITVHHVIGGIAYGNGLFVLAASEGSIFTSTDGLRWILQTSGTTQNFKCITYGANLFVAVAGGRIFVSGDAVNWTQLDAIVLYDNNSITYDGGVFTIATSQWHGSAFSMTSTDGINWVRIPDSPYVPPTPTPTPPPNTEL